MLIRGLLEKLYKQMKNFSFKQVEFSKSVEHKIHSHTKHWVIQGGVLVPFTSVIPAQALTYAMKKLYPALAASKVIVVCTDRGNKSHWIFDEEEVTKLGKWCIAHPKYVDKIFKHWRALNKQYYRIINELNNEGISNVLADFKRFYQIYLSQWCAPLIQEYYSPASNKFIKDLLRKYGTTKRLQKTMEVLTLPMKLSFLQSAELAVLDLAIKLSGKKLPRSLTQLCMRFPVLYRELTRVQQNYFWIHFSYRDTNPHTVEYFYKWVGRLLKMEKRKELKARQAELINYENSLKKFHQKVLGNTPLDKNEIRILKSFGFISYWQDERKKANLLGNYWCNNFLQLVAKQSEYSFTQLQQALPDELIDIIKKKKKTVTVNELKCRIKGSMYAVFAAGDEAITSAAWYKKIYQVILNTSLPSSSKRLTGMPASPGCVIGRVRKVIAPKIQGKNLKKGDILVTYMTRPDFIHLMHKAGAIITDEGGLTSHAAIVAREMGIPCVVGLRYAMRLLKDGDKVEVDAFKGVVRKI